MVASLNKEKRKTVAEESAKTRKAREKLRKKLEAFEKKITPQALEKKTVEIHRWIARHAAHRVVLRSKAISLFDENQNTAEISKKILGLVEQLQKEASDQFSSSAIEKAQISMKKWAQKNRVEELVSS